jgi:hypothetical protein
MIDAETLMDYLLIGLLMMQAFSWLPLARRQTETSPRGGFSTLPLRGILWQGMYRCWLL